MEQVKEFNKWVEHHGYESVRSGSWFFKVALYSFKRILTIEACKFLLYREEKSLVDWLDRAEKHASSLTPREYCPDQGYEDDLRTLKMTEYQDLIFTQRRWLSDREELITKLQTLRDKGFAHSDKEYFEKPGDLKTEFPVTWDEFYSLFNFIGKVLKRHYSLLFNIDVDMQISASDGVDVLLKQIRAFDRVWKNKNLQELGIKLFAFKKDDYDPEDIFIN